MMSTLQSSSCTSNCIILKRGHLLSSRPVGSPLWFFTFFYSAHLIWSGPLSIISLVSNSKLTDFTSAHVCCMLLLLLLSRFSHVRLCATPETAAHQAPPSLGFSRQEHWSGVPFPSPVHEREKQKWSRVWLFATPWTAAYQAPLSMGFSTQEYWSGSPVPSPYFFLMHFLFQFTV